MLCLTLVLSASAGANVRANLRVEGPAVTLDPGTRYATGTERVRKATRSDCSPKGGRATIHGPTALGIIQSAIQSGGRSAADLSPLRAQTFPSTPGYFVCRIGAYTSGDGFWLYKVNHVSPTIGADQYELHRGDAVLWFYANFNTGANTGDELGLRAPAKATAGQGFKVRVIAFDGDGSRSPVQGATVKGGDAPVTTNASGKAVVTASSAGRVRLDATHGSDIRSNREGVLVQ
jgi:hypothetical protein